MTYEISELHGLEFSVAMTADLDRALGGHLHKPGRQEDLAFAFWKPSVGATRYTALLTVVTWPDDSDRVLRGNVAFTPSYLERVLAAVPEGTGIALLHGHPARGWQDMSRDDIVAEHDRLAGQVAGRTGLPLVGLTRGTDGSWSGRFWARTGPRRYARLDARTVRVVGPTLRITFAPHDAPPASTPALGETVTVWGLRA